MNKEIAKAIKEKNKKHPVRKWWNKNGYKVNRVIFFPIWIVTVIYEKIQKNLNAKQAWSEERAKSILDYYVPRRADWDEEDKIFYFFDNGMGWGNLAKKYLKRKDRRWWNKYRGFYGGEIRDYLICHYEMDGFSKEVRDTSDGWTEIIFTMIEK